MLSSSWTKDAPWLTYLNLFTPSGAGHRPNVVILVCLVQQLPPVSSSSRCPVFHCPGFVSRCSWVSLSCDVRLASGTEIVLVYMFYPFATYGLTISIFFSLAVLMWVLVQSFSKVHRYLLIRSGQLIFSILHKDLCMKISPVGDWRSTSVDGDFRSLILE